MTQQELMEQFRRDREATFRRIYAQAFPRAARQIELRGGTPEEAKDIFQEALIILFEQCRTEELQIRGDVTAYLLGMCRNQWSNYLRRGRYEISTDDLPERATEAETDLSDRSSSILRYLEQAGKKCMDLLQAVYYFRYSMQEIAEEFGFRTVRSATVQKYKCMEKVRDQVKQQRDEPIPA